MIIQKIRGRLAVYKDKIFYVRRLRNDFRPNFFCGGAPVHGNLGDSAILIAELEFLKRFHKNSVNCTWAELYGYYGRAVRTMIMPWDKICLHGGGNMGDAWLEEELYRRKFIQNYKRRKVFIFPQTIHYSDTRLGIEEMDKSIVYYNRPNITMIAREEKSYAIMKKLYPKANILLTPDIVLSLPAQRFDVERKGALLCMRRDLEKKLTLTEEERLLAVLKTAGLDVNITDTVVSDTITDNNRERLVLDKMRELAGAKIVITDRLHGMVFCALTGTPCVVLANYNYKVKGTYDWIAYLPYIKYAETVEEAISFIPELLEVGYCIYDNEPLQSYFDTLQEFLMR